jgi:hypothetical protein
VGAFLLCVALLPDTYPRPNNPTSLPGSPSPPPSYSQAPMIFMPACFHEALHASGHRSRLNCESNTDAPFRLAGIY